VQRPVLVLRHALLSPASLLGVIALLLTTLIASLAPGPGNLVWLGPTRPVAMSNSQLADRAEWDPDYAKRLGRRMTEDFGYHRDRHWRCLRRLWRLESSWRVHADNPNSSAYGIPQALPGSKMSTAGDHWRRNAETQIRWGLRYVRARYERPCHALKHKHNYGWY
jgi:hypothetical protein